MLCTQVKTHNFTDIGQKKRFQAAGGNPVIKNTYLAAIEEVKNDNIHDVYLYGKLRCHRGSEQRFFYSLHK